MMKFFLESAIALLEGGSNPVKANLSGHKPVDYARTDAMKKLLEGYSVKVTISLFLLLPHIIFS